MNDTQERTVPWVLSDSVASPIGSLSGGELGQQVGSMLSGLGRVALLLLYGLYAEHTPSK